MNRVAYEEADEVPLVIWLEWQHRIRLTAHRLSVESTIGESRDRILRSRALLERPIYCPGLGLAMARSPGQGSCASTRSLDLATPAK
jgi:hypothetical protein